MSVKQSAMSEIADAVKNALMVLCEPLPNGCGLLLVCWSLTYLLMCLHLLIEVFVNVFTSSY